MVLLWFPLLCFSLSLTFSTLKFETLTSAGKSFGLLPLSARLSFPLYSILTLTHFWISHFHSHFALANRRRNFYSQIGCGVKPLLLRHLLPPGWHFLTHSSLIASSHSFSSPTLLAPPTNQLNCCQLNSTRQCTLTSIDKRSSGQTNNHQSSALNYQLTSLHFYFYALPLSYLRLSLQVALDSEERREAKRRRRNGKWSALIGVQQQHQQQPPSHICQSAADQHRSWRQQRRRTNERQQSIRWVNLPFLSIFCLLFSQLLLFTFLSCNLISTSHLLFISFWRSSNAARLIKVKLVSSTSSSSQVVRWKEGSACWVEGVRLGAWRRQVVCVDFKGSRECQ